MQAEVEEETKSSEESKRAGTVGIIYVYIVFSKCQDKSSIETGDRESGSKITEKQ